MRSPDFCAPLDPQCTVSYSILRRSPTFTVSLVHHIIKALGFLGRAADGFQAFGLEATNTTFTRRFGLSGPSMVTQSMLKGSRES